MKSVSTKIVGDYKLLIGKNMECVEIVWANSFLWVFLCEKNAYV